MEYDLITVAETEPFQRKASRLLTEDEKEELITYLAAFPKAVEKLVKYWSREK